MAPRAPRNLTEARQRKAELFAELTAQELELLEILATGTGSVFGSTRRSRTNIVVTKRRVEVKTDRAGRERRKVHEDMTRRPDQAIVHGLMSQGWLRFANMSLPSEPPGGYFWLTPGGKAAAQAFTEGRQPFVGWRLA